MPDPNMIKIDEHKIGFMFVCKAGNSSIKTLLNEKFFKGRTEFNVHGPKALAPHAEYCNRHNFGKDYLIFGTCRHPEDRLISCWKDKVLKQLHRGFSRRKYPFSLGMPFDKFVEGLMLIKDNARCDQHLRSQFYDLDLGRISHLIRVENFRSDWERARELIKKHCGQDYPEMKFHERNTGSFKPEISKETRALIEERFIKDYELLGYEKRS